MIEYFLQDPISEALEKRQDLIDLKAGKTLFPPTGQPINDYAWAPHAINMGESLHLQVVSRDVHLEPHKDIRFLKETRAPAVFTLRSYDDDQRVAMERLDYDNDNFELHPQSQVGLRALYEMSADVVIHLHDERRTDLPADVLAELRQDPPTMRRTSNYLEQRFPERGYQAGFSALMVLLVRIGRRIFEVDPEFDLS